MKRTVDLRWIRRTLARVRWLSDRVDAKDLARYLVEHGAADRGGGFGQFGAADYIGSLGRYLEDVNEYLTQQHPEQEQPCAVCGRDVREKTDRPDARYCSPACRQRAYRARVTGRQPGGQRSRHEYAVRDGSLYLPATRSVTPEPAGADPDDLPF